MLSKTTVVLGAGGPWGTAWMAGLILGLEDSGIDVRHPQAIIGSSAGAILGARLASGMSPLELFEDQTSIESQTRQLSVFQRLMPPKSEQAAPASSSPVSMLSILAKEWDDEEQRIRAVCELAVNAKTVSWDQFKSVMLATAPSNAPWPAVRFVATAIDVDARSLQAFDAHSGVEMTVATLASCAIPGLWPLVPINGRRYTDGGSWGSGDNAHLAAGASSVLIISPMAAQRAHRKTGAAVLDRDIQTLRSAGTRVHLLAADEASLTARGTGMPNPASMKAAAEAGRVQGRQEAVALQRALS